MIRIFDIFFSILGLLFFAPVFLIIIILSYLETSSPLFYQKRVGLNCRSFTIIKFRTMKLDTPSIATHLVNKLSITKIGYFLRKYKLDELPQLLNVLIGDMSLVGPRPCLLSQKKLIIERKKRGIFKTRPGITGLAQLKGISMKNANLLAKTDYKMIKNMNLSRYLHYIFSTILMLPKSKDI